MKEFLELLSNRIESNPWAVRFGRIESTKKSSIRLELRQIRLDSIRFTVITLANLSINWS